MCGALPKVTRQVSKNERFLPKFTCQASKNACFARDCEVYKASVSFETSSKSHASSLTYETSSKSHLSKSSKRALHTRLRAKVTHQAALPSSFAVPPPPNNTRLHANPSVTATFTSTTTRNLTIPCACHENFHVHMSNARKVLRLTRYVTSATPRNLTTPCACHENRASTPQSQRKVLRLPRKVTISYHVSFNKVCTTPHEWNDFDTF